MIKGYNNEEICMKETENKKYPDGTWFFEWELFKDSQKIANVILINELLCIKIGKHAHRYTIDVSEISYKFPEIKNLIIKLTLDILSGVNA